MESAVRRILVAQSVGLWIRLNRHLSGVSAVDLVETPTLESGRLLARLDRPAIVVFSGDEGRLEAVDLVRDLDERRSSGTRVVLVSEGLEPTPRPLSGEGRSLVVCSPEALVHVVTELLSHCEQPKETIELLVQYHTSASSGAGEGFVIVLDLDEQHLVLQGDQSFEIGAELSLDFFLPGPDPDSPRDKVALTCRIESSRDEVDLIYTAAISGIDAHATRAVQRFLTRSRA